MSWTKCPNCHKKTSDLAPACPRCGHPISRSTLFRQTYGTVHPITIIVAVSLNVLAAWLASFPIVSMIQRFRPSISQVDDVAQFLPRLTLPTLYLLLAMLVLVSGQLLIQKLGLLDRLEHLRRRPFPWLGTLANWLPAISIAVSVVVIAITMTGPTRSVIEDIETVDPRPSVLRSGRILTARNATQADTGWLDTVVAAPGEAIEFRLTVQNLVPDFVARDVSVTAFLPAALRSVQKASGAILSDNGGVGLGFIAVTVSDGSRQGLDFIPGHTTVFSQRCPRGCSSPADVTREKINVGNLAFTETAQVTWMAYLTNIRPPPPPPYEKPSALQYNRAQPNLLRLAVD